MSITFTDGSTPLNAANMNLLEQTPRKNAANGYVGLDASSYVQLPVGSQIVWASDTKLYRSAAGQLTTDGALLVGKTASGMTTGSEVNNAGYSRFVRASTPNDALQIGVNGDTNPRLSFDSGGKINWGPGNAAYDTNLYRSVAGQLKTDGQLVAAGTYMSANIGSAGQTTIGAAGPANQAGITFGPTADTNLYRSAAGLLKTDGNLQVGGQLQLGGNDTYLYRYGSYNTAAVGNMVSDGALSGWGFGTHATNDAGFRVFVRNDTWILFGLGAGTYDSALVRNGANIIACVNQSSVYGTLQAASFSVQSDRETKTNIEQVDAAAAQPHIDKLLQAGIYTYERDDTGERHLGLIADELPEEVIQHGHTGGPENVPDVIRTPMDFVDLYKLNTALLATVQHLETRIAALEAT